MAGKAGDGDCSAPSSGQCCIPAAHKPQGKTIEVLLDDDDYKDIFATFALSTTSRTATKNHLLRIVGRDAAVPEEIRIDICRLMPDSFSLFRDPAG